mgnify:CR=1 FL=1
MLLLSGTSTQVSPPSPLDLTPLPPGSALLPALVVDTVASAVAPVGEGIVMYLLWLTRRKEGSRRDEPMAVART